jgi:hypothetical protein
MKLLLQDAFIQFDTLFIIYGIVISPDAIDLINPANFGSYINHFPTLPPIYLLHSLLKHCPLH